MVELDDWVPIYSIIIVTIVILNMHFGIAYGDMLMPLKQWIPGLYGLDTILGLSVLILVLEKYWARVGGVLTFIFVFALIWLLG